MGRFGQFGEDRFGLGRLVVSATFRVVWAQPIEDLADKPRLSLRYFQVQPGLVLGWGVSAQDHMDFNSMTRIFVWPGDTNKSTCITSAV